MILREGSSSSKVFFLCVTILVLPRVSQARWLSFGGTKDEPGASVTLPLTTTTTLSTTTATALTTTTASTASTTSVSYPSYFRQKTLSMADQSNVVMQYVAGKFGDAFKVSLYKLGNYVPIRGVASVAADLGIPGGEYVMDALTPTSNPAAAQKSKAATIPAPREPTSINPRFSLWARAAVDPVEPDPVEPPEPVTPSPPIYREEVSSLMGTMFGERQCLMKLACLSGRRLSAVRGASAVTMILSTVAGVMPESLHEPYQALKNSIMYTDECTQYQCHDQSNPDP